MYTLFRTPPAQGPVSPTQTRISCILSSSCPIPGQSALLETWVAHGSFHNPTCQQSQTHGNSTSEMPPKSNSFLSHHCSWVPYYLSLSLWWQLSLWSPSQSFPPFYPILPLLLEFSSKKANLMCHSQWAPIWIESKLLPCSTRSADMELLYHPTLTATSPPSPPVNLAPYKQKYSCFSPFAKPFPPLCLLSPVSFLPSNHLHPHVSARSNSNACSLDSMGLFFFFCFWTSCHSSVYAVEGGVSLYVKVLQLSLQLVYLSEGLLCLPYLPILSSEDSAWLST